jgi:hypothetical protein
MWAHFLVESWWPTLDFRLGLFFSFLKDPLIIAGLYSHVSNVADIDPFTTIRPNKSLRPLARGFFISIYAGITHLFQALIYLIF